MCEDMTTKGAQPSAGAREACHVAAKRLGWSIEKSCHRPHRRKQIHGGHRLRNTERKP